jgi:hypothetical protein
MVTLGDAKRHLGIAHGDDDELIARLIASAVAYLEKTGVNVADENKPVGEAILLLVGVLFDRCRGDFKTRHVQVEGISSVTSFAPDLIDEANLKVIRALTDPYREMHL